MNPNEEKEREAFFFRQHQEIAHDRNLRRQELFREPSAETGRELFREPYALVSTDLGQVVVSEPLLIDLLRTDSLEAVLELCFGASTDNDSIKVVSRVGNPIPSGRVLIEMHPSLTWESREQDPAFLQAPYFQLVPIGTRIDRMSGNAIHVFRPRIARIHGVLVDDDDAVDAETAAGTVERLAQDAREYYPVSRVEVDSKFARFKAEFAFRVVARGNVGSFDERALRRQVLDTRMVLRTDEHVFDLDVLMERMLTHAELVHVFVLACGEEMLVITMQSLYGSTYRFFRGIGRIAFLGQGPHSNLFGPLRKKLIRVNWTPRTGAINLVFDIEDLAQGRSSLWPSFLRVSVILPAPPESSHTKVAIQMDFDDGNWIPAINFWDARLFVLESRDQAIPP